MTCATSERISPSRRDPTPHSRAVQRAREVAIRPLGCHGTFRTLGLGRPRGGDRRTWDAELVARRTDANCIHKPDPREQRVLRALHIEPLSAKDLVRGVRGAQQAPRARPHRSRALGKEIKDQILLHKGSIQEIVIIPENIRDLYKTTWEIKQRRVLEMAADRGPYIDQSMSLNIHMIDANSAKVSWHALRWLESRTQDRHVLPPNQGRHRCHPIHSAEQIRPRRCHDQGPRRTLRDLGTRCRHHGRDRLFIG